MLLALALAAAVAAPPEARDLAAAKRLAAANDAATASAAAAVEPRSATAFGSRRRRPGWQGVFGQFAKPIGPRGAYETPSR